MLVGRTVCGFVGGFWVDLCESIVGIFGFLGWW